VGCVDIAAGYLENGDAFEGLLLTVVCGLCVLDHLDLAGEFKFLLSGRTTSLKSPFESRNDHGKVCFYP